MAHSTAEVTACDRMCDAVERRRLVTGDVSDVTDDVSDVTDDVRNSKDLLAILPELLPTISEGRAGIDAKEADNWLYHLWGEIWDQNADLYLNLDKWMRNH